MEKQWNEKRRLVTNSPLHIPAWIDEVTDNFIEDNAKRVKELEKNDQEKELIINVENALNQLLGEMDMPEILIPEERIHILEPHEYEHQKRFGGRGTTYLEHIYVQRSNDPVRFLRDISHEMGHAASFQNILVQHTKVMGDEKLLDNLWIGQRQTGFDFSPKARNLRYKKFEGLNEATTELIAFDIRNKMIDQSTIPFSKEQITDLRSFAYANAPLLHEILKTISTTDHPYKRWKEELYRDYFTGSYKTVKKIGLAWKKMMGKNIIPILSEMSASDQAAIQVARMIGLEKVANKLEKSIKSDSPK